MKNVIFPPFQLKPTICNKKLCLADTICSRHISVYKSQVHELATDEAFSSNFKFGFNSCDNIIKPVSASLKLLSGSRFSRPIYPLWKSQRWEGREEKNQNGFDNAELPLLVKGFASVLYLYWLWPTMQLSDRVLVWHNEVLNFPANSDGKG